MRVIFTITTNLPNDTDKLREEMAICIAKMLVKNTDKEIIDMLIDKLEEEI